MQEEEAVPVANRGRHVRSKMKLVEARVVVQAA
jgi:hypothetical protein